MFESEIDPILWTCINWKKSRKIENSIFIKITPKYKVFLTLHVDDLIIGFDMQCVNETKILK